MTIPDLSSAPLIVTAEMSPPAQALFQRARDQHFPPERNLVPAHVTLFHHLPGVEIAAVNRDLARLAGETPALAARVQGVRHLGRGIAYKLHCPPLDALRAEMAVLWRGLLIPQDQATPQLHVTVQNKVTPDIAKALFSALEAQPLPPDFQFTGLLLWHYCDGPWTLARRHAFRGKALRL